MFAPARLGIEVMIDQTITIGNIIEIVVIAGGGVSVFAALRTTVKNINTKVDGIQVEIKKLGDILIEQARFDEKLSSMEKRVSIHDRRLDEMSHGEGFIRGRHGIDREYE